MPAASERPPSVFTWLGSLHRLASYGDQNPSDIVKAWNSEAGKHNQLKGSKASVIKAFLQNQSTKVVERLLNIVEFHGVSDQPFYEECLNTKKIFPKFVFRHTNPGWEKRLTVFEEGKYHVPLLPPKKSAVCVKQ